eukprot:scaffold6714_cov161-Prasinococcus_capsulatus_cf.AAC.1
MVAASRGRRACNQGAQASPRGAPIRSARCAARHQGPTHVRPAACSSSHAPRDSARSASASQRRPPTLYRARAALRGHGPD